MDFDKGSVRLYVFDNFNVQLYTSFFIEQCDRKAKFV